MRNKCTAPPKGFSSLVENIVFNNFPEVFAIQRLLEFEVRELRRDDLIPCK